MKYTMNVGVWFLCSVLFALVSNAYNWDPLWVDYNTNENPHATSPLEYWGEWKGHKYHPSPKNWRFPFYTVFLDRFVNGDPTNDNINGTYFEHDINSSQMRHGGDLQGFIDTLDYIHGMGVRGIYIAGSPFMNQPWQYDQYSPLDLSILEPHFGTLHMWREAVTEIHDRGMYVLLDNTFATLGDLIGFDGYLNTTTPFTLQEHHVQWKTDRHYWDFSFSNDYNETCNYPPLWNETGFPIDQDIKDQMVGCYNSEFDQYGDTEAFGVYPDFRRELSKFASVQDRLREWHVPVREKIENFYCMLMNQLDIDGYRYDKATQSTPDAMGSMNDAMRKCARKLGKHNFFLPGEITGGNDFGSIFVGRGRQPDMLPENQTQALTLTPDTLEPYTIRKKGHNALDSAAFHYTVYRTLTRFLGMDGNLEAGFDAPPNWIDMWNTFLMTNDMINPNTGEFDPRHMYGVTNQDVFRWPAITQGKERQMLGHFITSILLPGMPLLLWAEEQSFYVMDNTASNYLFGRQPISSSSAWQTHGCYSLDSTQYYQMPWDAARHGCGDITVGYDHRDPSSPVRNILRHMMQLREAFPVLNDGFFLQQLSNQTKGLLYPGSTGVITETGLWSVMRSGYPGIQEFNYSRDDESDHDRFQKPNAPVWLLYSNWNVSMRYQFDCRNNDTDLNITALIAPYDEGTTVKNLFYPFDEHRLVASMRTLGLNGSTNPNGCLDTLDMEPYDFRAYVPIHQWVGPKPMITRFTPGHDARIESFVHPNDTESVFMELEFNVEMDCDSVADSITFDSRTEIGDHPKIDRDSIRCGHLSASSITNTTLVGGVQSAFAWSATITGVANGIHRITVNNVSAAHSNDSTNSIDRFLFRIGQIDNPMVYPRYANYSTTLLHQTDSGKLLLNHSAAGADLFRYTTNFGSSYSDWMAYRGGVHEIEKQAWSGTKLQAWKGTHVRVEYFSRFAGSADTVQEADVDSTARRFPHLFLNGPYNLYGYDAGLNNEMKLTGDGTWELAWMTEWMASGSLAQINVWGMNPDGLPDQTYVMGDADGDSILDRLPPSALSAVAINVTDPPPRPFLSWKFVINDGDLRFRLVPAGNMWGQLTLYILLWVSPIIAAAVSCYIFVKGFYKIRFNDVGISKKEHGTPAIVAPYHDFDSESTLDEKKWLTKLKHTSFTGKFVQKVDSLNKAEEKRRTVLIATMEYDIEDWGIKIKIGGLGVMAQLMGKNLSHQDLIWVIPCCGGITYPIDERAQPMKVTVLGVDYEVQVQYHKLRNITYVLLDAPVFRQQTKSDPYPARMDDLQSAIYYSAWNQCIAQALERFPIDLYHINDYHGTVAPLYLLPKTIPACLSLHNAEFQGLWPMRNKKEREEVCSVFNLPEDVVKEYVQFGEIFNLLHAGASYLRVHQQGFGAVGVSKKYGVRANARYPIFWGLKKVQGLPNPDPTDTGEWDKKLPRLEDIHVDEDFETERKNLRIQAQEWAGLDQDASAELFVFVGRWSMQKGIDLIADVFADLLESNPKVQLITIGPVIDLYGKFAACKLDVLMKKYPTRVCSKPVFTALPPFIFSGAEFALIPSRDEPFGLVAVEFGRKGALGVGSRVGGLGNMPGWWYTVESITTTHLLKQFKGAILEAMASKPETRAMMRARAAKQRFPVAQWCEDLELLQSTSLRIFNKVKAEKRKSGMSRTSTLVDVSEKKTSSKHKRSSLNFSRLGARLNSLVSVGTEHGPGHVTAEDQNDGAMPDPNDIGLATSTVNNPSVFFEDNDDGDARSFSSLNSEDDDEVPKPVAVQQQVMYRGSASIVQIERPSHSRQTSMHSRVSSITSPESPTHSRPQSRAHSRVSSSASSIVSTPASEIEPAWPLPPSHAENTAAAGDLINFSEVTPGLTALPQLATATRRSMLSTEGVIGDKTDFKLQKVDPFFTDSSGYFHKIFEKKLETLDAKNSETTNCIEEFLVRSEKEWFNTFRNAKLGRLDPHVSVYSVRPDSIAPSTTEVTEVDDDEDDEDPSASDEFLLGKDYKPPTGIRKYMQVKVGDWPLYAYFMALGQILAANSYQITLLTGEVGQTATKLYVVASIYLGTSICWWLMYRRFASYISLSLPFFFYALAFMMIGVAPYGSYVGRGWMQNVGTGLYALASSSGSLFFALNFGDEGGALVKAWVFRACVIQGSQQIWVTMLWFWGHSISKASNAGVLTGDTGVAGTWKMTAITLPIAFVLFMVGIIMFLGLPSYYRQAPGNMPTFYKFLFKRKVVLWFLVTAVIQNFFLSAPYGRNWEFLFSSEHAKTWQVIVLVVIFFIGAWAGFLWIFGALSTRHSWILPLFAIGLGAPRWAQIWWGTSNIGLYLPWAGPQMWGALLSRALWLWLGLLDAIQGVGLGMIMLGTLTRVHVAFAVMSTQVLGSMATILARAVAPNRIGPGPISPDVSGGIGALWQPWFWVGLAANLLVCVGFYKFYRKEQLQKP